MDVTAGIETNFHILLLLDSGNNCGSSLVVGSRHGTEIAKRLSTLFPSN